MANAECIRSLFREREPSVASPCKVNITSMPLSSLTHISASSLLILLSCLAFLVQTVPTLSNSTSNVTSSLGINCRGSSLCPSDYLAADYIGIMLRIAKGLTHCPPESHFDCGPMNDTDFYQAGAHIVCLPQGKSFLGGLCAFTQGIVVSDGLALPISDATAAFGVTGALIKQKLEELSMHGCHICGSVPLGNGNDPRAAGILTVNYISGVACPGLCPPTHYHASDLVETV